VQSQFQVHEEFEAGIEVSSLMYVRFDQEEKPTGTLGDVVCLTWVRSILNSSCE